MIDIEADNALIWSRQGITQQMMDNLRRPEGQTSRDLEFYLSGNVEIRQQNVKDARILRADEIYYDVNRNAAIALHAGFADQSHFTRVFVRQTGRTPGRYRRDATVR